MFSLLHIDNNFFYKEIMHNLSVEKDLNYLSAKNPQRAFEIIKSHDIDMILTGLEFEGEDYELYIEKLMAIKGENTPLVVLSASENDELKNNLLAMGVTDFVLKNRLVDFLKTLLVTLESSNYIEAKLKTLKIAVLDDNKTHLRLMENIFGIYEVANVDYYTESRKLIESHEKYDIYLIDYVIPEISGEEVIASIRGHNEYAVIIAISSLNSQTVISKILMTGADDFINKPFSKHILMARLKANVRTYILMQQLKEKNEKLARLVKEDSLTGLYNRGFLLEVLESEISRAKRYGLPLSIFMFDIDHFKDINDTYGHHIGDEVLRAISRIWINTSRKIDVAGRYGGDEFIVILPETNIMGAMIYAERIRNEVDNIKLGDEDIKVTISGGIVEYNGEQALELIQEADKYLYKSKDFGRNTISKKEE